MKVTRESIDAVIATLSDHWQDGETPFDTLSRLIHERDIAVCAAAGANHHKTEARGARYLVAALIKSSPAKEIRVSRKALQACSAKTELLQFEDHLTGDYIYRVREGP